MKLKLGILAVLIVAWLGLWATNTGLLVFSAASSIPASRECHYFIGVSVLKRIAPFADRCPLMRNVG
jgi:hypothetical protein